MPTDTAPFGVTAASAAAVRLAGGRPASALDEAGRLMLASVPRDAPGVQLDEDWNVMGQRATVSGSAAFDDVPVNDVLPPNHGQI